MSERRDMAQQEEPLVIDQFSAQEACTVLAALRVFQQVCAAGGSIPPDLAHAIDPYYASGASTVEDLEHFDNAAQLSNSEIDALADRIAIRWPDDARSPNP